MQDMVSQASQTPLQGASTCPTDLWLHGRGAATSDAYSRDLGHFAAFVGVTDLANLTPALLNRVTVGVLQAWTATLDGSSATRARRIATVRSFFRFCAQLRLIEVDPSRVIKAPKIRDTLAQRILTEDDVARLIRAAKPGRDQVILRLLYGAGLRVSELCNLRWSDCVDRGTSGQISVMGKGEKLRTLLISESIWRDLIALKTQYAEFCFTNSRSRGTSSTHDTCPETGHMPKNTPIVSGNQTPLDRSSILRIVKNAAISAGLPQDISPHWMRHAHASHSLEHGASLQLLSSSLGHSNLAVTSRYVHARPNDSAGLYLLDIA